MMVDLPPASDFPNTLTINAEFPHPQISTVTPGERRYYPQYQTYENKKSGDPTTG